MRVRSCGFLISMLASVALYAPVGVLNAQLPPPQIIQQAVDREVPSLTGMTYQAARIAVAAAGLQIGKPVAEFNCGAEAEAGQIWKQIPQAGERVLKGSTVIPIYQPRGEGTVPNLADRTTAQANALLAKANLCPGQPKYLADAGPPDTIVSQEPLANTPVVWGTVVTVTLRQAPVPPRPEPVSVRLLVWPSDAAPDVDVVFVAEVTNADPAVPVNFVFGDGESSGWSSERKVSHRYAQPGSFEASALVLVNDAQTSSETITVEVAAVPLTSVRLIASPTNTDIGEAVHFSVEVTPADNKAGLSFKFDFGDGQATNWTTAGTTQHAYAHRGEYSASVAVSANGVETSSSPVTVSAHERETPRGPSIVTAYVLSEAPRAGSPLTIGANIEPPAEGVEYEYEFGDGAGNSWSSSSAVRHTYEQQGRYQVIVRARLGTRTLGSGSLWLDVGTAWWRLIAWTVAGLALLASVIAAAASLLRKKGPKHPQKHTVSDLQYRPYKPADVSVSRIDESGIVLEGIGFRMVAATPVYEVERPKQPEVEST